MIPALRKIIEEFGIQKLIKEYGGCQQCGWCCKNERLTIFRADVKKLGSILKPEHIQKDNEACVTLVLPCPFAIKNRCGVYSRRSDICKTYPFLFHYPGQFTIGYDCPLGKKICDDIIRYCNTVGIEIVGDELKTGTMKRVDQYIKDNNLNSGDGFQSKIVNIPFEMFTDFLKWRQKHARK